MKWYDVWGTEETYNHMSAGWSWAFDTPFDWFKQNASRSVASTRTWWCRGRRASRTRAACASSSCTSSITCPRSWRSPASARPNMVDGIKQKPIEGTSFAYTFDKKRQGPFAPHDPVFRDDGPVGAVSRRLAAEHQGRSRALGRLRRGQHDPLNNQVFQFYNLSKDFTSPRTSPRSIRKR
jgi:hypothetical protein